MEPPRRGRVVLVVAVLTGVLSVLAHASLAAGVVGQLVVVALCGVAGLACLRAARVTRSRWRAGWRLLAVAAALWAAGNLVTVVSVTFPGRGINSGIYPIQAGSMLAVLAALLVLPRPRWGAGQALRSWVDVVVLVISLALLGSVTLVERAVSGADGADRVFAVLYPTASLAMLGLAYELSRRHVHPPRPELALLSAAFASWLLGAAAYATLTPDAYVAPAWTSWLVAVGALLLTLAADLVVRPRDRQPVDLGPRAVRAVLSAPESLAVLTAAVVIASGLIHWAQQTLAGLLALAVLLRHAIVLTDSRRLHWRLESEVAERTADLRHLTHRYRRILDTVDDGIVSTDAHGAVVFVNASVTRMLGFDKAALLGRDACEVLCRPGEHACAFAAVRRGEVLREVEGELRCADGALLPVELHAAPQASSRPGGGAAVVAFRDVTERHAVEQVKRQFVSSVSHELRTPLTSVRGVLEMFADGDAGELTPSGRALAANASRGVERLSRLVDDIIDAEKLATGEFLLRCADLPLAPLLRQTVTSLQPLAGSAGVRLELGDLADGAECVVWADADRIEQAMVNLVGNAVKFSPSGGTVCVEAMLRPAPEGDGDDQGDDHGDDRGDDQGDAVVVVVRDEGPGIPADQLEHVFERFHQVPAGDRAAHGGTGLGLTITRSIVRQHGGVVWVESVLGQGASFCFTLPLSSRAPTPLRATDRRR